jgi:flagellar motor protein MotB
MRAKEQVAKGEAERNRVLLEARTQQADVATATAKQEQQNAKEAKRELAELQAKQTDRGMVVTLSDVLFDTGAATLKPGAGPRARTRRRLHATEPEHETDRRRAHRQRRIGYVQRRAVAAARRCGEEPR